MFDLEKILQNEVKVVMIGSYPPIIQSILDFDYTAGKKSPSIVGIVAAGRKIERYFFGKREITIPVFHSVDKIPSQKRETITYFINVSSGRRVLSSTTEAIEKLPGLIGGVVFAEDTPEKHSLDLATFAQSKNIFIVGPASVGFLIPKFIKLGAIGGVQHKQLVAAKLFNLGNVAVFSASGGTTNELINILAQNGKKISFALHFGGDRFPATPPRDAFLAAQNDNATTHIVYFGELGGVDEYAVCEMIQTGKLTKPVIAYIAGTVAEIFPESPQFGHAKAMAATKSETARAKRDALKAAGVQVAESFSEFVDLMKEIPTSESDEKSHFADASRDRDDTIEDMGDRKSALIATGLSQDRDGIVEILGQDLLTFSKGHSFAYIVSSMFLGRQIKSQELEDFVDFVLKLLVDHGPYVSGAVNTIVSARAGRDLPSALASGLLTIGPRFGGAINQAAENWIDGVAGGKSASEFVEEFAKKKKYISGIGHRKYRVDLPDPRVGEITSFTQGLEAKYTNFARDIERVTVAKKR